MASRKRHSTDNIIKKFVEEKKPRVLPFNNPKERHAYLMDNNLLSIHRMSGYCCCCAKPCNEWIYMPCCGCSIHYSCLTGYVLLDYEKFGYFSCPGCTSWLEEDLKVSCENHLGQTLVRRHLRYVNGLPING